MSQSKVSLQPRASVVITSRNRRDELRNAIRSALDQSVPVEVIVLDDNSDDGTPEMIRNEFPAVRLITQTDRTGYIVLRNRGAALATTPYIFSVDDDAIFTTRFVVEQVIREFSHPRVAAVAIPFANIRISPTIRQQAPSTDRLYVTDTFAGTAHAVRRGVFKQVGGYREFLIHQGEEGDLCTRMLNLGYVTRLGTSDPIHHFVSPKRDMTRLHYFGTRNNILVTWLNVPSLYLPVHLAGTTVNSLLHAIRVKAVWIKLRATVAGYCACLRYFSKRSAVSVGTYKLVRQLRTGPRRLEEIESQLAPLNPAES